MFKSPARLLIIILLFALLLRVVAAIVLPATAESIANLPDQQEYLSLGQNLLHHGSLRFFDARFQQTLYAYRLPGYPLFLAMCGCSVHIARFAQGIIDTSTVLAVFLIARRLSGDSTTALLGAALVAVNPFYVYFSTLLLSETLFIAALAWAIWLLVNGRWVRAALLLSAACYLRPAGLLFLPMVLYTGESNRPGGAAYRLRAQRLWDDVSRLVFAGMLAVLCLAPWAYRNHKVLGSWIWTTTNTGITLNDGFNPAATGASDQRILTSLPGAGSMNEQERSQYFSGRARAYIANHWTALPWLSIRKMARGWSPVPLSVEFGRPIYRLISAVYSVPFDALILIGLLPGRLAGQLARRTKLLLIAPAVIVTAQQVMSVGSIRYTLPAQATLAVLAAAGLRRVRNDREPGLE